MEAAYFKVPFRPISDLDKHELAHDYTLCSAILTRPRPGVVLATAFRQQARDLGRRCRVPASKLQLSPSLRTTLLQRYLERLYWSQLRDHGEETD